MIPKMIHYCWFGGKEKSDLLKQTIASWQRKLPDYKIVEWNEENFDYRMFLYTNQAYDLGKMAFVSDVARMYALYHHGGVYLDTDVEIKKDFSEIVAEKGMTLGFENSGKYVMTAFIASQKKHQICKEMIDIYVDRVFIKEDGEVDLTPNTYILTDLLQKKGLSCENRLQHIVEDTVVYPESYFSAYDFKFMEEISGPETYTVHRCHSSWMPKHNRFRFFIKKQLILILGQKQYRKLYKIFGSHVR